METKDFIEQLAEAIDVENAGFLTLDTKFRELEEWSSLAGLSVIAFFDEEFNKTISGAELRACSTIKDLYDLTLK